MGKTKPSYPTEFKEEAVRPVRERRPARTILRYAQEVRALAEQEWEQARLIPVSGISGTDEQERRATSALLAVMAAVSEFGRALTRAVGAPAGELRTYTEVPFVLGERRVVPDGLVRVERGKRRWTALVEVKTGTNCLEANQLEAYLDVARNEDFDVVLTISNEICSSPGGHPTAVDRRKLRRVALHHLSWTQVLTTAVVQKVHRGVSDPEQAWILGELIRYLEHPRSGALEFEDIGSAWPGVREAVRAGTLRANDKGAVEVVSRWEQLLRYACLRLGRELGVEVEPLLSRRELADPVARAQSLLTILEGRGILEGKIRIPNTVSPISLVADLRAQQVVASIELDAPRQGKPLTRVNWLVRQLHGAPDSVRIDAFAAHARGASTSELLRNAREDPNRLVSDPKRDLLTFRVAVAMPMGTKRGRSRGSFVASVLELLDLFYGDVVQDLKAWTAPPPKLPRAQVTEGLPPQSEPAGGTHPDIGVGVGDSVVEDGPSSQFPTEPLPMSTSSEAPAGNGEGDPDATALRDRTGEGDEDDAETRS